jgi:hypothetical protein
MQFYHKFFMHGFLLCLSTLWTLGVFHQIPLAAATDAIIDPDKMQSVTVNALVMEINQKEFLIIVGEKRIFVTKFIPGNTFKTNLLDPINGEIPLDGFSIGERVLVKGFMLPDGAIQAESISRIPHDPSDNN